MGQGVTLDLSEYRAGEAAALTELFYHSVHGVCLGDYTREQVDAWADGTADPALWEQSFLGRQVLVARLDGEIAGFADREGDYLDRLYVHKDHQRKGIARALCDGLERSAKEEGVERMRVHASITARGFFEKRGWRMVKAQQVERKGVRLTNFVMEKELTKGAGR